MFDVALTYAQRDSLISLQHTRKLQSTTERRLSSGREVNDVTDDVFRYFAAKSLSDTSVELQEYKHKIDQSISSIKDNLAVIESLVDYFKTIKSVFIGLYDKTPEEREQYDHVVLDILKQASQLLGDSRHEGVNLLVSDTDTLDVRFSERHTLSIDSIDLFQTGSGTLLSGRLGVYWRRADHQRFVDAEDVFSIPDNLLLRNLLIHDIPPSTAIEYTTLGHANVDGEVISAFIDNVDGIIRGLRTQSMRYGLIVGILQTRLDHNTQFSSTLNKGVDKYTLADINQEGAYLVALQTRLVLGLNALSVSSRQQSAVLALL